MCTIIALLIKYKFSYFYILETFPCFIMSAITHFCFSGSDAADLARIVSPASSQDVKDQKSSVESKQKVMVLNKISKHENLIKDETLHSGH